MTVPATGQPIFVPLTGLVRDVAERDLELLDDVAQAALRVALDALDIALEAIVAAVGHDDFCDALRRWGHDLEDIAEVLLAPLVEIGVAGAELLEPLAVKLLRHLYPRVAAVLTVAGVIVDDPSSGARFSFTALRDFLSNPPALVDEAFWDDVFASQGIEGTGRAPALLVALLLLAPDTIGAMRRGDLRIDPLLPPPVHPDAAPAWRDLRERSAGWIPVTFPLRHDTDGTLLLAELTSLRGDVAPELAISLLVRSQRRPAASGEVTDFELWLHPSADAPSHELRSGSGVDMKLEPGVRAGFGYDGTAGTWSAAVRARAGEPVNETSLTLGRETPDGAPDLLLGAPYDTRVVVQNLSAELHLRESGEPHVELVGKVEGFGVVLTNRWLRSLGEANTSLREGLRFDLDLTASIADGAGFNLAADGQLSFRWHLDKSFGLKVLQVKLHSILVVVPVHATQDQLDVRVEGRAHISATVGPVTIVLDGAGGWVGWWADDPGGDKQCAGLLPPTGAGLELDLPGVVAGGFLDFTGGPTDRYGGVVTVAIGPPKGTSGFSVTGFGLHELTGAPTDTERKTSIIVVLGATFRPGVQLGWGISLQGVGGIVGINRRADTDALRERLTSGAVGNILFADDPIRNAPVLLGDLAAIFPASAGTYVVGITCQLAWISVLDDSFVKLAVGIIVELPGPTKVVILGSARVQVPRFDSILSLQIDVVGVADLVHHTFEVDATILRGKLLKIFTITGDAALRASWGADPYLMATLGGFHPDFHPEPAVFPKLAKLRFAIDKSLLPKAVSLAGEGYLAVTTNTLQFGVELTATISSGSWNIQGKIGGDALVQLPFSFDISIHGSVEVRWKSHTLAGVKLKGGLKGTKPFVLSGEVCLEFLFFEACFSDSWELGSLDAADAIGLISLIPAMVEELERVENLTTVDSHDPQVLVAVRDGAQGPVFGPRGTLTWTQRRVPLDFTVATFEGSRLDAPQRITLTASVAGDAAPDWFSPGQFVALSEAETLALPSFERHQAGVAFTVAETRSGPVTTTIGVEEIRLPSPPRIGGIMIFPVGVLDRVAARDGGGAGAAPTGPGRFNVRDDVFSITGLAPGELVSAVEAHTRAGGVGGAAVAVQHVADAVVELVAP